MFSGKIRLFISFLLILLLISAGFFFAGRFKIKTPVGKGGAAPQIEIKSVGEAKSKIFKALFLGDLMLDRHVGEKIKKYGSDYSFKKLDINFLKNFELVSSNLEGAVTDDGAHYSPVYTYDFAFSPEKMDNLKKYGFSFFNLANNHISDQGERGVEETRKNLDHLDFSFSGCPDGQVGGCSGTVVRAGDYKVGMIGLSMVYKDFSLKKAIKEIKKFKDSTDLVIVNIHWGTEYRHQFSKHQQEVAHQLVEAGADAIIGHHPHVVEGMEIYQGKPIFYSLGNFIFDQYFSEDTQEGLAIGIVFQDKKPEIYFYPLKSKNSQPELMAGSNKINFLKKFLSWSEVDDYGKQILAGEMIMEK